MAAAFQSLTLITPTGGRELVVNGEEPPSEQQPRAQLLAYSRRQLPLAQRLHAALGRALRWSARGLYLSPLLLLPKALLLVVGDRQGPLASGDQLTLLFLALVLSFFGLLACWLLLFVLVGPRSARTARTSPAAPGRQLAGAMARLGYRTPQRPTPLPQLRALGHRRRPHFRKRIRLRGTVVPCSGRQTGPLLQEVWLEREGHAARWLTTEAFAVVSQDQPPLVVLCASAPVVLGPRVAAVGSRLDPRLEAVLADPQLPLTAHELAAQPALILSAGDQVELIASGGEAVQNLDGLVMGGRPLQLPQPEGGAGPGPYRQTQQRQGLVVTSRPATPILLQLL